MSSSSREAGGGGPRGGGGGGGGGAGAGEALEVLALMKVVSSLLQGPGGRALKEAISAGLLSSDDLGRVYGLTKELQSVSNGSSNSLSSRLLSSSSSLCLTSSSSSMDAALDVSSMSLDQEDEVASEEDHQDRKVTASSSASSLVLPPLIPPPPTGAGLLMPPTPSLSCLGGPATTTMMASPLSVEVIQCNKRCHQQYGYPSPSHHPPNSNSHGSPAPPAKRLVSSFSISSDNGQSKNHEGKLGIDALPDGTLLYIFDMVWSGRPSYGDNDGRKQLGDIALVCRQWRDLANSDELWKPLCIARWPWLKSLKGGPSELLPPLAAYKHQGEGRSPMVWHEFCVRHGRCMNKAGIGRRTSWGSEYSLSVEIFDRKGGFRLFCSYGRVSIMQQNPAPDGRWLTKLAITGFASCWHFSAASRDPVLSRFENIRQYFERSHERSLEHCLCTEVTVMNKNTGKMAVLYASSKETKRKLTAEKGGTCYFEEELRPASSTITSSSSSAPVHPHPQASYSNGGGELLSYLAASGMAVSKVLPPGADPTLPVPPEMEKDQKYRVDRLYLIFSTVRRWDVNKIFAGLDWA